MTKHVLAALLAAGCLSFSPTFVRAQTFEPGVDRQGSDYASFPMRRANPQACQNACARDANCRAWTFVHPGVQGPDARCWLKGRIPPARGSDCCVSGIMPRRY